MNLRKKILALGAFFIVLAAYFLIDTMLYPPKGVPILEYHMVNDTEDDAYTVPSEEFAQQLHYLKEQGYTTISLLDFIKAKKGKEILPDKPIVLTFDDGYVDNYTDLLPILEKENMKATVFIITNTIGTEGYLDWAQLRDMQKRNIEIGSHTANHLPVTTLDEKQKQDELNLSKLLLEWNGINTVFFFSYPNGAYDNETEKILKDGQYLGAVTGDAGLNTFATNPYLLQRVNIPRPRLGLLEFKVRLLKAEIFTRLGISQHS